MPQEPGEAGGVAIKQDAEQEGPCRADARPHRIGRAHRDFPLRQPEEIAAPEHEHQRDDYADQALSFDLRHL